MKVHREKGLSGAARQGMYSEPLLTFCQPTNFLPNVVHEKINTGNDIIAAIYKFTGRRVENVTQAESHARAEALEAEISLTDCPQYFCRGSEKKNWAGELSSEEQEQLEEDVGELETLENEIFDYQETILPYVKKQHAESKKAFEKLCKEKGRGEYHVRNHIENEIFRKHKMRPQAHHGGEKYTGVGIGILMNDVKTIVGEIKSYLVEIEHPLKEANKGEITTFFDFIERLLNMLDIMFSILRKTHEQLTEADKVKYEHSAKEAARYQYVLESIRTNL